jgi:transcriptional regulator with XRE-family HTH domain
VNKSSKKHKRTIKEEKVLAAFASHLREARAKQGFSQEEMSHLAGFSRSYYTEIETGKRNISLLNIVKIISVLNIDANSLIVTPNSERE